MKLSVVGSILGRTRSDCKTHLRVVTNLNKRSFVFLETDKRPASPTPLTFLVFHGSFISNAVSRTSLTTPSTVTLSSTPPLDPLKVDWTASAPMQVTVSIRTSQENSAIIKHHGMFVKNDKIIKDKTLPAPDSTSQCRKLKNKKHLIMQGNMGTFRQRDDNKTKKLLQDYAGGVGVGPPNLKSSSRTITSRFSISMCSPPAEADPTSRPTSSSSSSPSCATGLSTEHSSIYSWRYDEFDRLNTQRVRQLFCDVDELLYEGKVSSHSEGLREECQAWNGHSPHLRILGNQLEAPKQEGFEYIHRQASCGRSAVIYPCLDRREDPSQLCVEGHGLAPGPSSAAQAALDSRPLPSDHSLRSTQEEEEEEEEEVEEVYEAEGRLEEFLAYDVKELEDEGADQRKLRKICCHMAALEPTMGRGGGGGGGRTARGGGGGGVPPISPHACIKDAVVEEAFDDAWQLVMCTLQGLLRKHWELGGGGGALLGVAESGGQDLSEPSSQVNTKCQRLASSRSSNAKMFLGSSFNSTHDSSAFRMNLHGVMTVQAKPLQQRAQGLSEKSLCDSSDKGNMLTCDRTRAQRTGCVLSHRPPGQRRLPRLSGRARLPPSSHPTYSNQVLQGTKLCTVSEGLPSPPVSAVLRHRLPHLTSDSPEQDASLTRPPRYAQPRYRLLRGGMSSAVHPRSSLPPLREPTVTLEPLVRPNTTHTVWLDTPIKNSFSPVDFACSMKAPGRVALPAFPGDGSGMGVTGFSLGITSSMASGFSECATPPRRRRAYMSSSAAGEGGNGAVIVGAQCQRKMLSRLPGNGRRKFQVVMP